MIRTRQILGLARRQHGVVARRQLLRSASVPITWRQLARYRDDLDRDLRRMLGLSAVTLAA